MYVYTDIFSCMTAVLLWFELQRDIIFYIEKKELRTRRWFDEIHFERRSIPDHIRMSHPISNIYYFSNEKHSRFYCFSLEIQNYSALQMRCLLELGNEPESLYCWPYCCIIYRWGDYYSFAWNEFDTMWKKTKKKNSILLSVDSIRMSQVWLKCSAHRIFWSHSSVDNH